MVKGKMLSFNDDLRDVYSIRKNVFQNELNYTVAQDIDGKDNIAMHVLVENEKGNYVGTGRITFEDDCFIISKIAVIKEFRRKQYGDFVLRMLVNKAILSNASIIKLECNKEIVKFFENVGFKVVNEINSNIFMEMRENDFKTKCGCH